MTGRERMAMVFFYERSIGRCAADSLVSWRLPEKNDAPAAYPFLQEAGSEVAEYAEKCMSYLAFAKQVDDSLSGRHERLDALCLGDTPDVLCNVGLRDLPMLYTQKHLKDAVQPKSDDNYRAHGLTVAQIKQVPEKMANPTMVFDSPSRKDSVVVVLDLYDQDSLPIFVSICPNGRGTYMLREIETNFITSVYGKDRFYNYFENVLRPENVLYLDKKKCQDMLGEQVGIRFSQRIANLGTDGIIHQSRNIRKGPSGIPKKPDKPVSLGDEAKKMRDASQRFGSGTEQSTRERSDR